MSDQSTQDEIYSGPLTEGQMVAATRPPAIYANRFTVMVNDEIVKITFFEQATPDINEAVPRTSVAIGFKACEVLAKMLIDVPKAAQSK